MTVRQCFILAGQSNAAAYSPLATLRQDALASPYVPGAAQTAANEWTGAAPASVDTGYQYRYPTASANPCKYVENGRGLEDGIFDADGDYDKYGPQRPSGALGLTGSYGLELSFLQKYRADHPTTPLGFLKQTLGGTSLRGDWLPNTVVMGTARGGTSNTITLAASDFGSSVGYTACVLRIIAGTGAGQERTISAFNATTKVATLSANWTTVPDTTSTYGIERLQARILRTMIALYTARRNATDGPGNWRWAGFIWMQGEAGAHSAQTAISDAQYLSDARGLFAWVRGSTMCDRPDLPVLIGQIGDNWGWETNPNPYLLAAGYPYAALESSYQFSQGANPVDGRISTIPQQTRNNYLAGAVARRATQLVLGSDPHCASWNNDGYPIRPPYSLTAAANDLFAYHWGGPGNLAAGERAYAAWKASFDAAPVPQPIRRCRFRVGGREVVIRTGG